ncbi:MAG: hypothetical protein QOF72_2027, partial [Blastocatellia bacterium]|nr:hypothetical protein [Blastocatellia bacterium]
DACLDRVFMSCQGENTSFPNVNRNGTALSIYDLAGFLRIRENGGHEADENFGKAGVFSLAAHEHTVKARIESGVVEGGSTPGVNLMAAASRLFVESEKGVNDKDQAEIQSNMQGKVLESSKYPEIIFRSTQVRRNGDNAWKVSGDLPLHGASKLLIFDITRGNDAYQGTVRIK